MKNKLWIIIAISTALILTYFIFGSNTQNDISWKTATIEKGNIGMIISASGSLKATNTVEIGTQLSGVIDKVFVDFNDKVKKDQVLAKLDVRTLQANLQKVNASFHQTQIQLQQSERNYENMKKHNTGQVADLSVLEAEASLSQVKVQMEQAERNYLRYKDLFEKGVIAKVEYESRMTEYEQFKAAYEAKNATLNRAKANAGNIDINKSKEDVLFAKQNLASAKATQEQAKINLDLAYIKAPIDGIVLSRSIEVGQTVTASLSTPVLFTVANDLTKMEIEASIDEADIGYIKKGQSVEFSVDAYPDRFFNGEVEELRLQPQVVSNVVTYRVIITANNDDMKLMPGMTANVDITVANKNDVLKIPTVALNFSPPQQFKNEWIDYLKNIKSTGSNQDVVWVLENTKPVPKKVKTGLDDGSYTEIETNELTEGANVIMDMRSGNNKKTPKSNPLMPSKK